MVCEVHVRILQRALCGWVCLYIGSCQTFFATSKLTDEGLRLPFIKNSANECYYLDEFMPVPHHLVTGRSGAINLRYYTYNGASYKSWPKTQVVLSFYSRDERCWSLFEEWLGTE